MKPFVYIVLEGVDGSGKTTHTDRLLWGMREKDISPIALAEPSPKPIGAEIRDRLVNGPPMEPWEALGLFVADRRRQIESLKWMARQAETFDRQAIIIQDRSYFSTAVYQGNQPGCPTWEEIVRFHETWCPPIDRLIVFEARPEVIAQRVVARGKKADDYDKKAATRLERYRVVCGGRPETRFIDTSDRDVTEIAAVVWREVAQVIEEKSLVRKV